jgi:hypothetical protein
MTTHTSPLLVAPLGARVTLKPGARFHLDGATLVVGEGDLTEYRVVAYTLGAARDWHVRNAHGATVLVRTLSAEDEARTFTVIAPKGAHRGN